jgi:hypothetical protein
MKITPTDVMMVEEDQGNVSVTRDFLVQHAQYVQTLSLAYIVKTVNEDGLAHNVIDVMWGTQDPIAIYVM